MTGQPRPSTRRGIPLSKQQVVAAAISILDDEGEDALTFRALAARLATGSGALYWHVADKDAVLEAATDAALAGMMAGRADQPTPEAAIRALALDLFDLIDARPWVGAHLARAPWQFAMLQIIEAVGGLLQALGVPEPAEFDAGSTLVSYILGVAGQNAANARLCPRDMDRASFLARVAAQWRQHDEAAYPVVHRIAQRLRDHDDREQFLAGIDIILAGILSRR